MKALIRFGLTMIVGTAAIVGCSSSRSAAIDDKPNLPIFLLPAIDASDSGTEPDKLAYGGVTMDQIESLHRGHDLLRLFVWDHSAREIASVVPSDPEAFTFTLKDAIFKPIPCHACGGKEPVQKTCKACGGTGRERVTRQAEMLHSVSQALKTVDVDHYQVRILICTDGSWEDHSKEQEALYRASVEELAKIPHLEIIYYAVRPAQREAIRSRFPKLDKRGVLHFFGEGEEIKW